jgi:hypothetical protein
MTREPFRFVDMNLIVSPLHNWLTPSPASEGRSHRADARTHGVECKCFYIGPNAKSIPEWN